MALVVVVKSCANPDLTGSAAAAEASGAAAEAAAPEASAAAKVDVVRGGGAGVGALNPTGAIKPARGTAFPTAGLFALAKTVAISGTP